MKSRAESRMSKAVLTWIIFILHMFMSHCHCPSLAQPWGSALHQLFPYEPEQCPWAKSPSKALVIQSSSPKCHCCSPSLACHFHCGQGMAKKGMGCAQSRICRMMLSTVRCYRYELTHSAHLLPLFHTLYSLLYGTSRSSA